MKKRVHKGFVLIVNIYFTILFSACSEKKATIPLPNNVIAKDTFTLLLKDIYLIEGLFYQNTLATYSIDSASMYYSSVLQKYNVNQEKFKTSLLFYQENQPEILDIYEQILESLSIEEEKISTQEAHKP